MESLAACIVFALLPLLSFGDVCLSPKVDSSVYTTTEATASSQTVVVIQFSVKCTNGLKDMNLYAEFNGRSYPASRIDGGKYQVSFSGEHKAIPAGAYDVKFYDEDGYSDLRKAQRSGEATDSVKSLFSVPISHPGASKGPFVQSEFVAAAVGGLVWYMAYSAKNRLSN